VPTAPSVADSVGARAAAARLPEVGPTTMNARFLPKPQAPAGAIEFELVPVDAARAAHDQLPPGVESLPSLVPEYWPQRRRKPVPSDRALTGQAIDWLLSLPAPMRPKQLCERYPRVTNAIAAIEAPAEQLAHLEGLLVDRRGNRAGFPQDVQYELEALYDFLYRRTHLPAR
jgi:hypothetical protein